MGNPDKRLISIVVEELTNATRSKACGQVGIYAGGHKK